MCLILWWIDLSGSMYILSGCLCSRQFVCLFSVGMSVSLSSFVLIPNFQPVRRDFGCRSTLPQCHICSTQWHPSRYLIKEDNATGRPICSVWRTDTGQDLPNLPLLTWKRALEFLLSPEIGGDLGVLMVAVTVKKLPFCLLSTYSSKSLQLSSSLTQCFGLKFARAPVIDIRYIWMPQKKVLYCRDINGQFP